MSRQLGVRANCIDTGTDCNGKQWQAGEEVFHRDGRASSRVRSVRRAFSTPGVRFREVFGKANTMPRF